MTGPCVRVGRAVRMPREVPLGRYVAYMPTSAMARRVTAWARLLERGAEGDEFTFACGGGPEGCAEARAELDGDEVLLTPLPAEQTLHALMDHLSLVRAEGLVTSLRRADLPWAAEVDRLLEVMRAPNCETFVDLGGPVEPEDVRRILVVMTGGPHDETAVRCAVRLAEALDGTVTVARIEPDVGEASAKLGERALDHLLHEADLDDCARIERRVVVDTHPIRGILASYEEHDLVLVGMDDLTMLKNVEKPLASASIAVVKRTPPLRTRRRASWLPQVSPGDYADLMQQLRVGSRWSADFVMMLGLASAVASLGLMQNSPAVVIGSMLLAPLMTPMIGFGLSLLQANGKLARASGKAISLGFLLTLGVSMLLGFLDPGDTLAPEVLARGSPNLFDLGIALFAAMAAGYALARPTLAGAVAGVAIATALVPPVCACGISLANGIRDLLTSQSDAGRLVAQDSFMNALGAALLFVTNLFAIILSSALVFSLMGISVPRTFSRARRVARAGTIALVIALGLLCIPLGIILKSQMEVGRAQPLGHPVARHVVQVAMDYVEEDADVRVMFMARSSVRPLMVVYLATRRTLKKEYIHGLRDRLREASDDPELEIAIIGVRWSDETSKDDERED